jgi:hypothetical protein
MAVPNANAYVNAGGVSHADMLALLRILWSIGDGNSISSDISDSSYVLKRVVAELQRASATGKPLGCT